MFSLMFGKTVQSRCYRYGSVSRTFMILMFKVLFIFFLMIRRPPRSTLDGTSFPTRRSSDLLIVRVPELVLPIDGGHLGLKFARDFQAEVRSEEHTSELQSHHPISYAVFC